MTKTQSLTAEFLERFPGPFICQDESLGDDFAFDITCRTTKQNIASVSSWNYRLPCELVARVISASLNTLLDHEKLVDDELPLYSHEIAAFRGMYQGPYSSDEFECDYRGQGHMVVSESNGSDVVTFFNADYPDGQARLIALQIAKLLNAME